MEINSSIQTLSQTKNRLLELDPYDVILLVVGATVVIYTVYSMSSHWTRFVRDTLFGHNKSSVIQTMKRDPTTVAYIGNGKDRMSTELCFTCIETNRMLVELAKVTGKPVDCFEPCDLCR